MSHLSFLMKRFQALAHLQEYELEELVISDGAIRFNKVEQVAIEAVLE